MVYTDFTKYSHADLRKMAQALDPGAVMAAGDPWRKAATTLKEIRKTLTNVSTEAATSWEGTTSDSFHASMLTLAANINEAAAYANDAANTLHNMSEAMAQAKRDMPEEPGNWDKIKDTVGDFFSSEDDHIQVADRKKAEAAAVMQTLAMHYRIATPALKAPPPPGPNPRNPGTRDDVRDVGPQDQSSMAAAAAAMISGTSFGTTGAPERATSVPVSRRSTGPEGSMATRSSSRSTPAPTDSGIKGGTAQTPPKQSITATRGSGADISGTPVSRPSGSLPGPITSGTQTSGLSTTSPLSPTSGPIAGGGGQTNAGPEGPSVLGGPVGTGFGQGRTGFGGREFPGGVTPLEGTGSGAGRIVGGGGEAYPDIGVKRAGGSGARSSGAVRETPLPGAGARGTQAFTEGGSGLGARNRLGAEPGSRAAGVMAPGMPMSEAQRRKRDRGKDGKRPDYLVEDEETWAPNKPANPNVVE
ncbi:PPE domain-containing protein [Streptomyces viridifaciens]|uniref:WXG100 family type VII secretion target n=1 Tax=Kitasatospora aureofaciens TaxID=1894 RepID=UPI0009340E86|nr:PPE domain-containing protein [Streptomyces viridifaciens]UKZ07817.1 PPE domain-containing protein [Streptomyces viridifaciens]